MERFPGQREQDDALMAQDEAGRTEQPWVLGRDLAPGAPDNGHPVAEDEPSKGGSRMMLAAAAAVLSGVALLVAGLMLLSDQLAASAWPLVLAVVAVVVAAVALFGWWRQGSADSTRSPT